MAILEVLPSFKQAEWRIKSNSEDCISYLSAPRTAPEALFTGLCSVPVDACSASSSARNSLMEWAPARSKMERSRWRRARTAAFIAFPQPVSAHHAPQAKSAELPQKSHISQSNPRIHAPESSGCSSLFAWIRSVKRQRRSAAARYFSFPVARAASWNPSRAKPVVYKVSHPATQSTVLRETLFRHCSGQGNFFPPQRGSPH